jgi:hypothetical protein
MFVLRLLSAAIFAASVSGCVTSPRELANPDAISLRSAVMDVVDTLHAARDSHKNERKIGMYPSEAVVTFNMAASSTETTGLQLGASIPAAVSVVPITASFSDTNVGVGSRGNQITITFKNIYDLPRPGAPAAGGKKPAAAPAGGKQQSGDSQPPPDMMKCFGPAPLPDYCGGVAFTIQQKLMKQREQGG